MEVDSVEEGLMSSNDVEYQQLPDYTNLPPRLPDYTVYLIAFGYCLSASLLFIIMKSTANKYKFVSASEFIFLMHFTGTFLVYYMHKSLSSDPLNILTLWKFLPAAIMFNLSLLTNTQLLLHTNIYTLILFFSAVPIFVAIGEILFLHQPCPSFQIWFSLTTIFAGSILIYASSHYQFTAMACTWALAYLITMCVSFVYMKHVVTNIGLNVLGLMMYHHLEVPLLLILQMIIVGEFNEVADDLSKEPESCTFRDMLFYLSTISLSLAMNFFGFCCQRAMSATGFAVLGIVNTLLTLVINYAIWDIHLPLVGTVGIFICWIGGVMYHEFRESSTKSNDEDEEEMDSDMKSSGHKDMESGDQKKINRWIEA